MTGRRAVIGLCMLCALIVSAVAAQGASAGNTTAYTCNEVLSGAVFTDAHCKTLKVPPGGAGFAHVAFNGNTTDARLTNSLTGGETSKAKLTSTQAGVKEELQATGVLGEGNLNNKEEGAEMWSEGEGKITYTGVTVNAPAEKGCKVFEHLGGETMGAEGTVKTNQLKATTKGQEMAVKFEPASGETFAIFWVTGCKGSEAIESLNGTYEVKGTVKTTSVTGATSAFEEANVTTQGTLKVRGQKAGLDGTITIEARNNINDPYRAISSTTTP